MDEAARKSASPHVASPALEQPAAAGGGDGPSVPAPLYTVNAGVKLPSRADLEKVQMAERLTDPSDAVKRKDPLVPVIEGEQDIVKLLDANYAMIAHLVRLRHSRPPGTPSPVERRLMALVEENLSLLVASQKPSSVITPRTAQAARSLMRHSAESEVKPPPKQPAPAATAPK
mmetsp:Transcript_60442/g.142589  ORF Transcript_60442/g.142589 Transcript_60442/m.142589 type:complete len:173 (-) Transcript_60442:521-1039(-)